LLDLVQILDDLLAALKIEIAELGQREFASGPMEQSDAEPIFELTDSLADVPFRHAHRSGGAGKAADLDDLDELFKPFPSAHDVWAPAMSADRSPF